MSKIRSLYSSLVTLGWITMKTIIISGGGTGGHVYPAIGIANELRKLDSNLRIVFVGTKERLESRVVPKYGFEFLTIPVAGFPRKITLQWAPVIYKLASGLLRSLKILHRLKPVAVIGTGGYVSGPVLFSAVLRHIPTIIQEQNAFPSVTNRILARWVNQIHIALEAAKKYFDSDKVYVTGNPIRSEFGTLRGLRAAKRNANYGEFELDPNRTTLTITGGSQGAHAINMAVLDALDRFEPLADRLQIIHQTGPEDYEQVKKRYERSPIKNLVCPYFDELPKVYGLTDLIICRAGGMTVAEITACGLPAILIPFPFATADHQRFNAQAMVDADAAVLLLEDELSGERLAQTITKILNNTKRFKKMSEASKKIGKPYAAQKIAKMAFGLIFNHQSSLSFHRNTDLAMKTKADNPKCVS